MEEYYTMQPIIDGSPNLGFIGQYNSLEEAMKGAKKYIDNFQDVEEVRLFHTKITNLDIVIKPKNK